MLFCTDGSSVGKAACVAYGKEHVVEKELAFTQIVELGAVAIVFQLFVDKAFSLAHSVLSAKSR